MGWRGVSFWSWRRDLARCGGEKLENPIFLGQLKFKPILRWRRGEGRRVIFSHCRGCCLRWWWCVVVSSGVGEMKSVKKLESRTSAQERRGLKSWSKLYQRHFRHPLNYSRVNLLFTTAHGKIRGPVKSESVVSFLFTS